MSLSSEALADATMTMRPFTLLSDLRARRWARRLIELQELLDAEPLGRLEASSADRAALRLERSRLIDRLHRASLRLAEDAPIRRCIDDICTAHHAWSIASIPEDAERAAREY